MTTEAGIQPSIISRSATCSSFRHSSLLSSLYYSSPRPRRFCARLVSVYSVGIMSEPLAQHEFSDGGLDAAIAFFRRTRNELRMLRLVRVSTEWVQLLRYQRRLL